MTGTLVNTAGIIAGSLIGVLLKKGIPEHVTTSIMKAQGVGIAMISLSGILTAMISTDPATGALIGSGGLLLFISLVIGCAAGEFIRIEDRINSFSKKIEDKLGADGLAKGFVTATLIFSIGALVVIGPLDEGLRGDPSVLFTKAMIDFITSIVLASSLGIGVILAAVPVFVIQGGITLLAEVISPFITYHLLDLFCMVGYSLVLCIGINFVVDAKIKVANLLPALVIPILYYYF